MSPRQPDPSWLAVRLEGVEVSDVEAPQIGDTRPAPEDSDAEQASDAERPDTVRQVREWAERVQRRNAELEPLRAENDALRRQLGLAHAGVDPTSLFGQTVIAAAERDDVSDPLAVSALARTLRSELSGGRGRQEDR
jgi:hypothetical protein